MHFEDILNNISGFGRYQKILCFTLIPSSTGLVGLIYYVQLIVLSAAPYECSLYSNATQGVTVLQVNIAVFTQT